MKRVKADNFIWAAVVVAVASYVGILAYNKTLSPKSFMEFWNPVPTAVFIEVCLWFAFRKWLWPLRWWRDWLVPFPDLRGTWKGTLKSNWIDPRTNTTPPEREIYLVIRQSFTTITCLMYSNESQSVSYSAEFLTDEEGESPPKLAYSYSNTPRASVRDRSQIHFGTVLLNISEQPKKMLIGNYWTDRNTTGEMTLAFHSKASPDFLRSAKRNDAQQQQ